MVSVIIPCFNAQNYIAKAIGSVFSQLYKDWEIILVDNNSTDGTYAVLEQFAGDFPERISVFSEKRKGSNYARNLGLYYAKGDYIQFLDADDEIMPSKLEDQLAKMDKAHAQVVLGSFVKKSDKYAVEVIVNDKRNFWKSYASSSLGITSANLYKKSALVAVNGWNEQLSSSQEYDLLLRLIKNGAVVELDERLSTVIYEVPNSITRGSSPERTMEVINDYINLRMSLKEYLKKEQLLTGALNSFIDQCIYRVLIGRRRHHPVYVEEKIRLLKLDVPLSYKVKVRANSMLKQIFLIFVAIMISSAANAQTAGPRFGAFYFDGWGGDTLHLTPALKKMENREPIWGWKTSTPEIVAQQVAFAADAGLDFFNFCWYFNSKTNPKIGGDPLNNALGYYLDLSDRKNLHFSIMVTNNGQYTLQATDWTRLVNYWCGLFKDPDYVKVNGLPLLTFFSYPSLLKTFKTTAGIHKALEELRTAAKANGLEGVTVAISTSQLATLSKPIKAAGFDVVTSYNDHDRMLGKMSLSKGLAKVSSKSAAASTVVATQQRSVWNSNKSLSALPLIPSLTLNWDDSPWSKGKAGKNFGGYTESSVTRAVSNAKAWMKSNSQALTKEKIVFIYAWNEYGEGAWLTPSKSGFDPLKALKAAIKNDE